MRFKNYSTLKVTGLNYEQLLNKLKKHNIDVINIKKQKNELFLTVESKNVKKIIAISSGSCYNVSEIRSYGFKYALILLKQKLALIIALLFCLTLMLINLNFISSISISGLERIDSKDIMQFLSSKNITKHSSKNNIDTKELEQDLLLEFSDLSIASVAFKGTTLLLNFKEKIYVDIIDGEAGDIISPFNAQITSLIVSKGTPLYKVGDSVKKGDVIVAGYQNNNKAQKVKAVAKIELNCFISEKLEVGNKRTQIIRTGKIIKEYSYYYNNQVLFNFKPTVPFEIYETTNEKIKMFNMLPFYINKCTYYECTEEVVNVDFEKEVEILKKQLQYKTYNQIEANDEIINEEFYISKENNINTIVFNLTVKRKIE